MSPYRQTISLYLNHFKAKAKLVDDITKHAEAGYSKQIENLNGNITLIEKTKQSEVSILTRQL